MDGTWADEEMQISLEKLKTSFDTVPSKAFLSARNRANPFESLKVFLFSFFFFLSLSSPSFSL